MYLEEFSHQVRLTTPAASTHFPQIIWQTSSVVSRIAGMREAAKIAGESVDFRRVKIRHEKVDNP